jgi:hypothetical protein
MNITRAAPLALLVLAASAIAFAPPVGKPQDGKGAPAAAAEGAGDSAAKRRDIVRLLELNGTAGLMQKQIDAMADGMSGAGMPPQGVEAMKQVFRENSQQMVDMTVDVYDRNLSHEDVLALVRFYETPEGKRITKALPTIMQQSTEAGMKWGQSLQPKLMKRMQELREAESKKSSGGPGAGGAGAGKGG